MSSADKEDKIPWHERPDGTTHYFTGAHGYGKMTVSGWRRITLSHPNGEVYDVCIHDPDHGWSWVSTLRAKHLGYYERAGVYVSCPNELVKPLDVTTEDTGIVATPVPVAGQAIRFDSGKPQLSLVLEMRRALEGASRGLEEGVLKYGRGNYAKGDGLPLDKILDSLLRHASAYASGEMMDMDSKDANGNPVPHVDKILTNALMLAELWHRKHNN